MAGRKFLYILLFILPTPNKNTPCCWQKLQNVWKCIEKQKKGHTKLCHSEAITVNVVVSVLFVVFFLFIFHVLELCLCSIYILHVYSSLLDEGCDRLSPGLLPLGAGHPPSRCRGSFLPDPGTPLTRTREPRFLGFFIPCGRSETVCRRAGPCPVVQIIL